MRHFMPDSIANDFTNAPRISAGFFLDRNPIQCDDIRQDAADAVVPAARRRRNSVIQAEKRLVIAQPFFPPHILRRLIFDEKCDILHPRPEPFRHGVREFFSDDGFEFFPVHLAHEYAPPEDLIALAALAAVIALAFPELSMQKYESLETLLDVGTSGTATA